MSSGTPSTPTLIIKEADVLSAPMAAEHKELVLVHFRRLKKILEEKDEDALSEGTSKQAARERLARMTLVIRDYTAKHARGEVDDEVESMIQDVVDASLYVAGRKHTYSQPASTDPLLLGREQEVAALVQELQAGSEDDVVELWQAQSSDNVLPDSSNVVNIGKDIDWTAIRPSASESDLLRHSDGNATVENRPKWERSLSQRKLSDMNRGWPPALSESDASEGES